MHSRNREISTRIGNFAHSVSSKRRFIHHHQINMEKIGKLLKDVHMKKTFINAEERLYSKIIGLLRTTLVVLENCSLYGCGSSCSWSGTQAVAQVNQDAQC